MVMETGIQEENEHLYLPTRNRERKTIRMRARSKKIIVPPFAEEILVIVSKEVLNKKLKTLITLSKKAYETENPSDIKSYDNELQAFKNLTTSNITIRLPEDNSFSNFKNFEDALTIDIPEENIFSSVSDYKYDASTGLVNVLILK